MAAEKTTRRKQRSSKREGSEGGEGALRTRSDPRKERRYEPKASATAVVSVLVLSIGAVLLGAGTYAQWLRPEELGPHKAAPWLLLAGALSLLAIAVFGPRNPRPIRVGDAGVGAEIEDNEITRIEWRDVTRILLGGDVLTVESPSANLSIPVKLHPQAAARVIAEARARIPARVEDVNDESFDALDESEGQVLPLEPPQVAGTRCKATDKLIAFEKDARLCTRCGEVYYKDSVPERCLTCDAKLR